MRRGFRDPTRPSYVFDLETTGLLTGYGPEIRTDVGISQFALRESGKTGGFNRFTDILRDPLQKYNAGEITAANYAEILAAGGPSGVRWQKGFKTPTNVLFGVHQRHLEATRAALALPQGRAALAKESKLVSLMTRHLRQGHVMRGWNIESDMLVMSQVAARSNPAIYQRWTRAINRARNMGQIEDMASGTRKFMFLAAQESVMQPKMGGREFFTLGQVDPRIREQVRIGKLTLKELDKLNYDKLIEPHKGFEEFFARRRGRKGDPRISYERYTAWLERKTIFAGQVQTFATGQKYPDIRFAKGWSADILSRALAPEGIKGSVLERQAAAIIGKAVPHEAMADTAFEEVFEDVFRVKSKTWAGSWKEVAPRLTKYDIHSQREFFNRMRAGTLHKARSQVVEVAKESALHIDDTWLRVMGEKTLSAKVHAPQIAAAAAGQPETLRKIYSKAHRELSGKWRAFGRVHPRIAATAQILAGITIADALIPERGRRLKGVRDPADAPYAEIDGIHFGPSSMGARALTDFGSGRSVSNETSKSFNALMMYRSSMAVRYPDIGGIAHDELEKNYEMWVNMLAHGQHRLGRLSGYQTVRAATLGVPGLNRDAWVGVIDLKSYKIKVDDADTLALQRRGVMGMFRKPVSVRLAGIDAPEIEHPGTCGAISEDQFAGEQGGEYLKNLIEHQQSLRLIIDPSSRTYNRHVGVLIGNRTNNLNLQLVRAGAASALPWSGKKRIVNENIFAEAEALAARGGVGMWASKGWQMHRAMGLIAGERVTNTTLTSMRRLVKSHALYDWYGLVQEAHDNKRPWTPDDMLRMYQTGSAYRAEIMSATNQRTQDIGFMPGIRDAHTPWNIAGYGITPSRMDHGNVSEFSSGRPQTSIPQLESIAGFLEQAKVPMATPESVAEELRAVRVPVMQRPSEQLLAEADRPYQVLADSMRPPAPRPPPMAMKPRSKPTPTAPPPAAIKHASRPFVPREPGVVPMGAKASSLRSLQIGAGVAAGAIALTGLAIGTWALFKGREEKAASTRPYNHPNEFMAMKPFGDFVASHKAGAWAQHHQAADAVAAKEKRVAFLHLSLLPLGMFMHQQPHFGLLEAWNYFYQAKGLKKLGGKERVIEARSRIAKGLRDQGYTRMEVRMWLRNRATQKGFVAKIRKDLGSKDAVSRNYGWWEAIKKYPEKLSAQLASKKSKLGESYAPRVQQWFKNLTMKPAAQRYGISVNDYLKIAKEGRLDKLKKLKHASMMSQKVGAAKYLYKHLVQNTEGFVAKIGATAKLLGNTGNLEKMAAAHRANLIGLVPSEAKQIKNIFTSLGGRLTRMAKESVDTMLTYPKITKALSKAGSRVSKIGLSRFGRVVGRVPIFNVAFGLLEGYTTMDQYENATKGFIVGQATGMARIATFSLLSWGTFVAAGKAGAAAGGAIGSMVAPGPGTAVGAVIGAVAAAAVYVAGYLAAEMALTGATRFAMETVLGVRRRRTIDPAAYMPPEQLYPQYGFPTMRSNGVNSFTQFHAMDPARKDMTPFGGAYNPIKGQDIDSRTLQIANNRKRVTAKPMAPRPVSMFTPTFGLVNDVMWKRRNRSRIRSVVEKGSLRPRQPALDRNRSRMLHRAA